MSIQVEHNVPISPARARRKRPWGEISVGDKGTAALPVPYDLPEHRHRFAVWAAARASQRGCEGATNDNLRHAVEQAGIRDETSKPEFSDVDSAQFDVLHRRWCRSIIAALGERGVPEFPYGRAAKLVAIYLKATVILGGGANTPVGRAIHPPVDETLLENLAACSKIRSKWGKTKWTQLNENEYYDLIAQLRAAVPCESPFWMIEEYWNSTGER
jgi:hypothetical protein